MAERPAVPSRTLSPDGSFPTIERRGLKARPLSDLYHSLMKMSWPPFFGLLVLFYLGINLLFALAYLEVGGIEHVQPGSLADAFFFSIQTLSTIGYGRMTPVTPAANALVTAEATVGMLTLAVITGLNFAKFSRPTARVLFSDRMVIQLRDGRPTLLMRMANARGNQIVQAQLHLVLIRNEVTREGERIRRFHDLKLVRSQNSVFALSWLAMHLIDEQSPLFGQTAESLARDGTEFVLSLQGVDETFNQVVHARHAWHNSEVVWNHRFADVFITDASGLRYMDLSRLNDVIPVEPGLP